MCVNGEPDYWTRRRRGLRARLEECAPSLSELYAGAVEMLYGDDIPGKTRFVAHAVREIGNRLPDYVVGEVVRRSRVDVGGLDRLANLWEQANLPFDSPIIADTVLAEGSPPEFFPEVRVALHRVAEMLRAHRESRETQPERAARLFVGIDPGSDDSRNSLRPAVEQWLDTPQYFMRFVHVGSPATGEVEEREFTERFELFEATLDALLQGYFSGVEVLNEILEDTNS